MTIQIKHRYSGDTIFESESESIKDAMIKAVNQGADLQGAYLRGADLRGADLRGAYLQGADLRGADLQGADLQGAYLQGAYLQRADLRGADLQGADLQGAYLQRADLRGADLRGARGINKHLSTPLTLLQDQVGKIRLYKLVNSDNEGPYARGNGHTPIVYEKGEAYTVNNAETNDVKQYAAGISVATLDWCIKEWQDGYRILIAEFTRADIAAIPIATDGKIRLHKCKIVGEKDLKELGLDENK